MKFPDAITVQRSTTADAYGNPGHDWTSPEEHSEVGFAVAGSARRKDETVFMPPTADVLAGDRMVVNGVQYEVLGAPKLLRSPSKAVMLSVSIQRLPAV